MRKSVSIAVLACVGLALAAAVVQAAGVVSQNLVASITGTVAGTPAKPKAVKLALRLYATTSDGSVPPPANHIVVFLPRGLIFQGSKFKSCSLAVLNDPSQGPSKCPSGSKIGTGTATARVGTTADSQTEQLVVTVFNGPKGKSVLIHLHGTTPAAVDSAFEAKLTPIRSGQYATKLDVKIPQSLYEPVPGFFTPLTDFRTTIKATTRVAGKSYGIVATTSCPKGKKWSFKATFDYPNGGAQDNAATQQKCS